MRRVVIGKLAASEIQRVLRRSEAEFGVAARSRYRQLLDRAIRDVAANPAHPGVRAIDDIRPGYRLYHLSHDREVCINSIHQRRQIGPRGERGRGP